MQPYQKATEEIRRQGELPIKAAKAVGSTALAAGTALGINRVLPLLSEYIPEDLAVKGLSKIDPRFGTFINKAKSAGKNFEDIKNFIKEKAFEGESQEVAENPKSLGIVDTLWNKFNEGKINHNDPSLSAFLKVAKSLSTTQGLNNKDKFSKLYEIFEELRGHGLSIPEMAKELYRAYGKNLQNQAEAKVAQQSSQTGPGQQALMDILQKINQARGV